MKRKEGVNQGSNRLGRACTPLPCILCLAVGLLLWPPGAVVVVTAAPQLAPQLVEEDENGIILVKVGGSSITNKARKETLNEDALDWFTSVLANEISPSFTTSRKHHSREQQTCTTHQNNGEEQKPCSNNDIGNRNTKSFVVVHGAGSFGHHTAKYYGLSGHSKPPPSNTSTNVNNEERTRLMQGLSETRLSVQKLNQKVVATFVEHGMNAVAISPCFSIPGMQAHGGGDDDESVQESLRAVVFSTLQAGLVPVLHGDACLYGTMAGILSGDTLMEILGGAPWISRAVFLTDVDGVYTRDPRTDPTAQILRSIQVDSNGSIQSSSTVQVEASESLHEHDVTGGLKVRTLIHLI